MTDGVQNSEKSAKSRLSNPRVRNIFCARIPSKTWTSTIRKDEVSRPKKNSCLGAQASRASGFSAQVKPPDHGNTIMDYHSEIPTNSMSTPVEFSSCCPELSRQKDITTQTNFAAIRNNRLANTPDCPMKFAPLSTLLFYGHPSRAAKSRKKN